MKTLGVTLFGARIGVGLALAVAAAGAAASDAARNLCRIGRVSESAIGKEAALEGRIRKIVAGTTLAQKIGQMTQPEIRSANADAFDCATIKP